MHLLDAWTSLTLADLLRLLVLPFAAVMATFLPGRRAARVAALMLAAAVLGLRELSPALAPRLGWALVWAALAWWVGRAGPAAEGAGPRRRQQVEAWVLGMPLGIGVLLLLLAALSRQGLAAEAARPAVLGVVLLSLGLLHLLTRPHVRRALLGFGLLAFGIEWLASAVRVTDVLHEGPPAGAALAAAALTLAVMVRLVHAREVLARAPLVSDAHDLHD